MNGALRPAPPRFSLHGTALFLDFDGTLVEIAPQPELVTVAPDLPPLLQHLSGALGGALAVVSGRPIAEIDRFLAPVKLAAAGAHGSELRHAPDGDITVIGARVPDPIRERFAAIIGDLRTRFPGLRVEDKDTAIAVHYRLAPDAAPALTVALDSLAIPSPWEILAGHCVYEIKSRGLTKGSAVTQMMAGAALQGRRPVFLGDDRTDLDGIAAAVKLGGGGIAIGGLQSEAAQWSLPDPAAVRAWLRMLLDG